MKMTAMITEAVRNIRSLKKAEGTDISSAKWHTANPTHSIATRPKLICRPLLGVRISLSINNAKGAVTMMVSTASPAPIKACGSLFAT